MLVDFSASGYSKDEAITDINMKEHQVLEIIEVDIHSQTVLKRFGVPYIEDKTEIDSKFTDETVESGHAYHLFFHHDTESQQGYLIISLPNACLGIYDYNSTNLLYVFKAKSKGDIIHSTVFSNPSSANTLFWVTDKLTIYKINTHDLQGAVNIKKPQRLKLSSEVMINEIQVHPTLPLLFAACADGLIRIWNYEDSTEYPPYRIKDKEPCSMTTINFNLSGGFLLSGDEQGAVMIWDSSNINTKNESMLENSLRTTLYPIVSAKWFTYKPFSENYRFVCLVQDCTAQLYQFQFIDSNSYGRPGKSKLKSKINLLCVLHIHDDLKVKSPLWSYNIRS